MSSEKYLNDIRNRPALIYFVDLTCKLYIKFSDVSRKFYLELSNSSYLTHLYSCIWMFFKCFTQKALTLVNPHLHLDMFRPFYWNMAQLCEKVSCKLQQLQSNSKTSIDRQK